MANFYSRTKRIGAKRVNTTETVKISIHYFVIMDFSSWLKCRLWTSFRATSCCTNVFSQTLCNMKSLSARYYNKYTLLLLDTGRYYFIMKVWNLTMTCESIFYNSPLKATAVRFPTFTITKRFANYFNPWPQMSDTLNPTKTSNSITNFMKS